MDVQNVILAAVVFGILVGINIVLFYMNKNTPKPEGCEDIKADCEGCQDWSCVNHPKHSER